MNICLTCSIIVSHNQQTLDKSDERGDHVAGIAKPHCNSSSGKSKVHKRDASFGHEQDSPVSAPGGLTCNTVDHNPHCSFGTPDICKGNDIIVKNLSVRPSALVATGFATVVSCESRVAADINADSRLNFSNGEAKADCTAASIGESGSMVRTIGDCTEADYLFLTFIFQIEHSSNTKYNRFTQLAGIR